MYIANNWRSRWIVGKDCFLVESECYVRWQFSSVGLIELTVKRRISRDVVRVLKEWTATCEKERTYFHTRLFSTGAKEDVWEELRRVVERRVGWWCGQVGVEEKVRGDERDCMSAGMEYKVQSAEE